MARKKNADEFDYDTNMDGIDNDLNFAEEPNFDDPIDFVDDISNEELLPELMQQRPIECDGINCVIVVDGIPEVEPGSRLEKLKLIIRKIFSNFGKIVKEHYIVDDNTKKIKNYIFIQYASQRQAIEAVKHGNNHVLDKKHTFLVNHFSDFSKFENIPLDWEESKPEPYQSQGKPKSWLLDPDACDQYGIVYEGGNKVAVYTNVLPDSVEVDARVNWTETYIKWSPLGTYMATFHSKGIALWGGQDFHKIAKFLHPGVTYIDFSPCEKYLVTFSPSAVMESARNSDKESGNPTAIIIWETRTGILKRSFDADIRSIWPIFKWSFKDQYFARINASDGGILSIYETPSCGMLDKKSIKVPGMMDFSWSPTENILAYWVAEDKDVPARVVLIEVPSRHEIRVKNLFSVADCKMHWQQTGDYLCVKVDRYNKLRKDDSVAGKYAGLYFNFEVFHMREKQIPVDSVEIKDKVQAFRWEPVGNKFAIIHGDAPSFSVSFYSVKTGQTPVLVKKYERMATNHIFWSPAGQFVVLAGLHNMNGVLEFIDTADFTTMNSSDHFMCTDVEWDPTGRYLMTGVSWWGHKVDNAFWMWSFQGRLMKRFLPDRFCQLLWRPRPPTLLSAERIKEIKKNLKKYSVNFDNKDRMRLNKASKELMEKRSAMYKEYMEYRSRQNAMVAASMNILRSLRGEMDLLNAEDEAATAEEEEIVEFLLKEEETIIE